MKVIIVGGGASGLTAALAIKKRKPNYEVLVIDKNNKLGKKLRATGGGKCNMANLGSIKGQYKDEIRANKLFSDIKVKDLINFFNDNGVATVNFGVYVYPYSESANALTDTLISKGRKLGVQYIKEEKVIDYKNNLLITDKNKYHFDKLIIATGLGSQPKLGADASFVFNLSKHGYKVINPTPVLLPIKTVESTKEVDGLRRKVNLKLISHNKTYMDESGELNFKKDGISGIVSFHAASAYFRNNLKDATIIVDFLPKIKFNGSYEDYFVTPIANYLKKVGNPKKVIYHIKGFYDANESVASTGGVSLNNVNDSFESKIEKGVYIIGEALDQDGLCGGFNLMWAFATALKVSLNI